MGIYRGYILTREWIESGQPHRLRYSGISDLGPFEILITNNRPLFFIPRAANIPKPFFHCDRRPVNLTTFDGRPVDGVYFNSQHLLYKARRYYDEQGIQTFEADIYPQERYLMERFIHGEIEFEGPCHPRKGVLQFVNPHIRKGEYSPLFSVLSLDIETGQDGTLYSIACHFKGPTGLGETIQPPHPMNGVVLMLDENAQHTDRPLSRHSHADGGTAGKGIDEVLPGYSSEILSDGGYLYRMSTEKALLKGFLNVIDVFDPDMIIGWHVIGFDLLFLERKYRDYRIPFSIGRNQGPPKIQEVRKGLFRADICGRVVIDGPTTLRAAFYSFDNFRLETVASALLGAGKDIGEDKDKVAEIERRFREDKRGLARYNLLDCKLVTDIFEKTGLIDLVYKRATISGLSMDRVGMSVAAFDYFMLPHIHRKGVVAPNVRDIVSTGHAQGGWVFAKEPGFYEHVVVLDFKSLYPSIIRTFNIDPLSRLNADQDPLHTPVEITFSRSAHVLPGYIKTLMDKRDQAKKDNDPHLSQAIKILMNSFYGVMGTAGCRFYHNDLPAAITGTGQWILKATRRYLEQDGYEVIYGDTDSVFVCLKQTDLSDCDGASKKLVSRTNGFITQKILDEFGLESQLEIEYEKHFIRFFLPALRGGGSAAKKRYAGMITKEGKPTLVLTGLEFVRSDWTRFARNFQYQLFQRIFHDQEVVAWTKKIVSDLKTHVYDADLVYQKRLTKPPHEYTKMVPPHVKAALLLGKEGANRKESRYVMTLRGPIPVELPHTDLDYRHYMEKQLKPIFDAVMVFFDLSFNEIIGGQQLSLF
ncbi:MAG: DNA polymerase II [Desulfobacterium sp.]